MPEQREIVDRLGVARTLPGGGSKCEVSQGSFHLRPESHRTARFPAETKAKASEFMNDRNTIRES